MLIGIDYSAYFHYTTPNIGVFYIYNNKPLRKTKSALAIQEETDLESSAHNTGTR